MSDAPEDSGQRYEVRFEVRPGVPRTLGWAETLAQAEKMASTQSLLASTYRAWVVDRDAVPPRLGAAHVDFDWRAAATNYRRELRRLRPLVDPRLLRCEVTGNPTGTDTRPGGRPCPCQACTLLERRLERET